jgi:CheY-like chemotaxis protein
MPCRVVGLVDASRSPRILIADDDASQGFVSEMLTAVGFQTRQVSNGAEAVASFEAWQPDLILMDLHMPVMGGEAATRAIRAMGRLPRVTIFIVTASWLEDGRARAIEAGADAWLPKPVREEQLFAEIGARLGVDYLREPAPLPRRSPVPAPEHLSALVADAIPKEVAEALLRACQMADYDRADQLLGSLAREHPVVADELRAILDRFDYDALTAALPK